MLRFLLSIDRAGGNAGRRRLLRDVTGSLADGFPPFMGIGGCVSLERELMGHAEFVSDAALRDILALDVEFLSSNRANYAIRKVKRSLWFGLFAKIVVALEFVEEFCWSDHVVTRLVLLQNSSLAFKRTSNERLCGAVILVREANA